MYRFTALVVFVRLFAGTATVLYKTSSNGQAVTTLSDPASATSTNSFAQTSPSAYLKRRSTSSLPASVHAQKSTHPPKSPPRSSAWPQGRTSSRPSGPHSKHKPNSSPSPSTNTCTHTLVTHFTMKTLSSLPAVASPSHVALYQHREPGIRP
jgi:hypothetical protein